MKHIHKRDCISIALVTIVLISLCAGCASPLVNAAGGDSATNVRAPAFVGALVAGAPAACAQGSNSLDLFVRGTDNALWWERWNGTSWSNWASLGGVLTSSPAATSPSSGAIDVFVRGTDNALWERTTTDGGGSWSAWTSIGGQIASGTGPAACSWGSRLDVFVEGTNGALYQKTWSGSWSNWASLGGVLTSSPAATSPSSGAIDVFVRGTDNALWERTTTDGGGSWSAWTSIGGQIASGTGPAACSWGSRLDVFVEGTNGALYQKTWSGSWSNWLLSAGSSPRHPPRPHRPAARSTSLSAAPTTPFGRRRTTAFGPAGNPSTACPRLRRQLFFTFPKQDQRGSTRGRQAPAITRTSAPPAYFKPNQTATRIGVISGKMIHLSTSRRAAQQTTRT